MAKASFKLKIYMYCEEKNWDFKEGENLYNI